MSHPPYSNNSTENNRQQSEHQNTPRVRRKPNLRMIASGRAFSNQPEHPNPTPTHQPSMAIALLHFSFLAEEGHMPRETANNIFGNIINMQPAIPRYNR